MGRLNRIGTQASQIHIYNFYPTEPVEQTITLKQKARIKLQAFHSLLGEDSQIFSDDEEVGTFGLFEKELAEEQDEQLQFLMDLREFQKTNPEEFRKIKNLPAKTRNAVGDSTLHQQSTVFLKDNKRFAFYQIYYQDNKTKATEMTFVQTAKTLQAQMKKDTQPLPDFHYPTCSTSTKRI